MDEQLDDLLLGMVDRLEPFCRHVPHFDLDRIMSSTCQPVRCSIHYVVEAVCWVAEMPSRWIEQAKLKAIPVTSYLFHSQPHQEIPNSSNPIPVQCKLSPGAQLSAPKRGQFGPGTQLFRTCHPTFSLRCCIHPR